MLQEHDIPDEVTAVLRTLAGLKPHEQLPEKLEAAYWKIKRIADRASVRVSDQLLVTIVCLSGFGEPTEREKAPPNLVDLWQARKVRYGARVTCTWRDQSRQGILVGVSSPGEVKVILDGDESAEERVLPASQVRLLEQPVKAA